MNNNQVLSRCRIWIQIYRGRNIKIFLILYTIIAAYDTVGSQLFNGKLPTIVDLLPQWDWWFWLIIGLIALWWIALEQVFHDSIDRTSTNWIVRYKFRTGHLPPIPKEILPVIQNYKDGQPLSKDIQVITPSAQYWARLMPSHRDQLLELIEWLGQDRRDFLARMEMMRPSGQPNNVQFRWKK